MKQRDGKGKKMIEKLDDLVDLHTHTIASGHARDTIEDMVEKAKNRGIRLYGITDHAVTMPGTCDEAYFHNLKNLKRDYYEEMELCLGVELNIISYEGEVDMPECDLKEMDVAIASIHNTIGYMAGTIEQNTNAIIKAMKNPYVNIIGHPDDGRVPLDYERIVKASKEYGTLLELNNNSISSGFRLNARENAGIMLEYCKKYSVPIIIGSDAHATSVVGRHEAAIELINEVGLDYELVLNFYPEQVKKYLNKYRKK